MQSGLVNVDSVQEMSRNNSALSREGTRVWEPVSISATSEEKCRGSNKGEKARHYFAQLFWRSDHHDEI